MASLQATSGQTVADAADSRLTVTATDPTSALSINVGQFPIESTEDAVIGSTSLATIGSDLTTSLEVLVQSIQSLDQSLADGSEAALTVTAADPTTSLEVLVQSLQSLDQSTIDGSESALTVTAADPTVSLRVTVQSLTSLQQTVVDASDSRLTVTATDPTTSLEILISRLGISSTTAGAVGGSGALSIAVPITTETDGAVGGSGYLRISESREASLVVLIAETIDRTADLNITTLGTESRTTDLDVPIAENRTRTTDLSITVLGIESRTSDLSITTFGTESRTSSLDIYIADVVDRTADLSITTLGTESRTTNLAVIPAPERRFTTPLSLVVRGTFTLPPVGMRVTIQGTRVYPLGLDMVIEVRRPHSLIRVWGDVSTRYFGGNASDANFFENWNVAPGGAVITEGIGGFSLGDRLLTYTTPNTIPTAGTFDKYSVPLAVAANTSVEGFRALFAFQMQSFGPSNILLFGCFNGTNSPVSDITAGDLVGMSIEADKDVVQFRAWAGTAVSSAALASGLPASRFVDAPLLIEIETVTGGATTDLEFRFYERLVSLDRPLVTISLQTTTAPTVTHVAMSSLGRRTPELSTSQPNLRVQFDYADVEPGTGAVYQQSHLFEVADAKFRPYDDRLPLILPNTGPFILSDSLVSDEGYWRLDTALASTLAFSGGMAEVSGAVFPETTQTLGASWYRVECDVMGGTYTAGTNGHGIGLHGVGNVATGDSIIAYVNSFSGTATLTSTVSGTPTVLGSTSFATQAGRWYRFVLDVRQRTGGDVLVNFYVDGTLVLSEIDTAAPVAGTPLLYNTNSASAFFRSLLVRGGMNTVFVQQSDSGAVTTDARHDLLYVDDSDPAITVHAFSTDSPVLAPDTAPLVVVKGSPNPGFNNVGMLWSATHSGTWTLRANSTGTTDGIELQSGTYPNAFERVSLNWAFADLPQVDGLYDVTLYLIADSGKPTSKKLGEYILP